MTNLVGSVFQAPPVTGSFSRSAVNAACGVNTLLSQWFAALMVMIALAGGAPAFYYIPQSSLAAMTIVAVANLIDFRVALKLWRSSKEDFLVWLTGFLGVMFFGVEIGMGSAFAVSVLLLLLQISRAGNEIELYDEEFVLLDSLKSDDSACSATFATLRFGGSLVFPAATAVKDDLGTLLKSQPGIRALVFDFHRASFADSSGLHALEEMASRFQRADIAMFAVNVSPSLRARLEGTRILEVLIECESLAAAVRHARSTTNCLPLCQLSLNVISDDSKDSRLQASTAL
eukprot:m.345391 g.345391  ORF g.345391 m.345391 type:complete len:288 (-) comp55813_c0_seq6:1554-2417(-)